MNKKQFFSEFIKKGNTVGAVTPSSKFLVKKMVEPIDFAKVKCIVEFGPGTGNITREILHRMPKDAELIVFEINKEFCDKLKMIKDKRIHIINDSAEKLESYLSKKNIEKVDYIISSLPFTAIPNKVVKTILMNAKNVLSAKGAFIQFQYSLNYYIRLKKFFLNVNLDFVAINFPPAFIFICTN